MRVCSQNVLALVGFLLRQWSGGLADEKAPGRSGSGSHTSLLDLHESCSAYNRLSKPCATVQTVHVMCVRNERTAGLCQTGFALCAQALIMHVRFLPSTRLLAAAARRAQCLGDGR